MIERLMSALMIFMHVLALKWMLPIAVCFFYPSVGLAEMIEQTAELAEMLDMGLCTCWHHWLKWMERLKWMLPIAVCFFYPSVG